MNKGGGWAGAEIVAWLHTDDLYLSGALTRVGEAFAEYAGGRG